MVLAEGFQRLFIIFMCGVAERFKLFSIAPWIATVIWRPDDCVEEERICQVGAGRADALDLTLCSQSSPKSYSYLKVLRLVSARTWARVALRASSGVSLR